MMRPVVLPDSALTALRHLAEYRFLTASQMVRLGDVRGTPRSMSNLLKQLAETHRLVDRASFGVHPTNGKLENVYFLTAKGAALLAHEIELPADTIKFPKSMGTLFQRDYFHRLACLDFEIAFKSALRSRGFECLRYDRYFDPVGDARASKGAPLQAMTTISLTGGQSIVPDAAVMYRNGERPFLFLIELSMGSNARRVVEQLHAHVGLLEDGRLSQRYGFDRGHFVVCLFETASCMESVMRQMADDTDLHPSLSQHFLFGQLPTLTKGFPTEWRMWNRGLKPFYGFEQALNAQGYARDTYPTGCG